VGLPSSGCSLYSVVPQGDWPFIDSNQNRTIPVVTGSLAWAGWARGSSTNATASRAACSIPIARRGSRSYRLDVGPTSQAAQCENHDTRSEINSDPNTRKSKSDDWHLPHSGTTHRGETTSQAPTGVKQTLSIPAGWIIAVLTEASSKPESDGDQPEVRRE